MGGRDVVADLKNIERIQGTDIPGALVITSALQHYYTPKNWIRKDFFSKKKLRKNFLVNKFRSKKFWVKKNLGKKILGQKNFGL